MPKQQLLLPFLEMSAVYFLSLLFILRIIYLVTDFNNLDSFFPCKMRQGKSPVSSLGAVSASTSSHRPPWRHHCDISPSFPTRRHSNETGDLTSLYRWHSDSRDGIHPFTPPTSSVGPLRVSLDTGLLDDNIDVIYGYINGWETQDLIKDLYRRQSQA
jgi:hypothetical protein